MDTLLNLKIGNKCIVKKVCACGDMKRRLLDLGIIKGTVIEAVGQNPTDNLTAFSVRGGIIALRGSDANLIIIEHYNEKNPGDINYE